MWSRDKIALGRGGMRRHTQGTGFKIHREEPSSRQPPPLLLPLLPQKTKKYPHPPNNQIFAFGLSCGIKCSPAGRAPPVKGWLVADCRRPSSSLAPLRCPCAARRPTPGPSSFARPPSDDHRCHRRPAATATPSPLPSMVGLLVCCFAVPPMMTTAMADVTATTLRRTTMTMPPTPPRTAIAPGQ